MEDIWGGGGVAGNITPYVTRHPLTQQKYVKVILNMHICRRKCFIITQGMTCKKCIKLMMPGVEIIDVNEKSL